MSRRSNIQGASRVTPVARAVARAVVAVAAGLALIGASTRVGNTPASLAALPPSRVTPADSAAGAYLTVVTGCNDCHTSTWDATGGRTPAVEQLTGGAIGYRGPWGTTYAANLRLLASQVSEDAWVRLLRTARGGTGRPPMPWTNTRQMRERDLRLMHRYLRRLGPAGRAAPAFVPPGAEPVTPYLVMVPRPPAR